MINILLNLIRQNIGYILLILFIVGFIWLNNAKGRLGERIIKFITKAEYGKLSKDALYDIVTKIHRSDLDERMVLVMAETIRSIPILGIAFKFLPKPFVVIWLNKQVQGIFNFAEVALKGGKVYSDNTCTIPVVDEATLINNASNVATKGVDMILPKMEATDKVLLELTEKVNQISEVVNKMKINNITTHIPKKEEVINTVEEKVIDETKELKAKVGNILDTLPGVNDILEKRKDDTKVDGEDDNYITIGGNRIKIK
nr:MAG TPA: hypothetical protein [Caudoviricetes sp.]